MLASNPQKSRCEQKGNERMIMNIIASVIGSAIVYAVTKVAEYWWRHR